jgi:hypothetical protein
VSLRRPTGKSRTRGCRARRPSRGAARKAAARNGRTQGRANCHRDFMWNLDGNVLTPYRRPVHCVQRGQHHGDHAAVIAVTTSASPPARRTATVSGDQGAKAAER